MATKNRISSLTLTITSKINSYITILSLEKYHNVAQVRRCRLRLFFIKKVLSSCCNHKKNPTNYLLTLLQCNDMAEQRRYTVFRGTWYRYCGGGPRPNRMWIKRIRKKRLIVSVEYSINYPPIFNCREFFVQFFLSCI